jgi:hypothetical protein
MMSLQEQIITNLQRDLINQTIIIDTLCDVLINSDIISKEELVEKINSNIIRVENQVSEQIKSENQRKLLRQILLNYKGNIGEA